MVEKLLRDNVDREEVRARQCRRVLLSMVGGEWIPDVLSLAGVFWRDETLRRQSSPHEAVATAERSCERGHVSFSKRLASAHTTNISSPYAYINDRRPLSPIIA